MFAIPAFDNLSTDDLQARAERWFEDWEAPTSDLSNIDQFYHLVLPRNIFLKSLSLGSKVLDVGAGDGSLVIQTRWPLLERPDLRLYALSLDVGMHFEKYAAFEIKDFEADPDVFPDVTFDAMVCAHFIEHMRDPKRSIAFFARKMRSGGRLYIEWPHPMTVRLPGRTQLQAQGINISTFNFFDDQTHIEAWKAEQIMNIFEASGFSIETGGRVFLPWVGSQLRDHAISDGDETRMTLGAWAAFGWAQYLVLNRH